MSPIRLPGFSWDPIAKRYRDAAGRFVDRARIRLALDQAIARKSAELRTLANELRGGNVSLEAWWSKSRALVKDVNLYSAASAKGGWAQMTASDYGAVGHAVKVQYKYLDKFAGEIYSGLPLDGRFLARVALYAKSGRVLYASFVDEMMADAGFDQERNRLRPADHCQMCLVMTALGWVAYGTLVPIGERTCMANCECLIEYRRSSDGAVV